MMTDELGKTDWDSWWLLTNHYLEAASAEKPQAEGQNIIAKIQFHSGSTVGFREENVERAQDRPQASGNLFLNQGTVALTIEEPTMRPNASKERGLQKKKNLLYSPMSVLKF